MTFSFSFFMQDNVEKSVLLMSMPTIELKIESRFFFFKIIKVCNYTSGNIYFERMGNVTV